MTWKVSGQVEATMGGIRSSGPPGGRPGRAHPFKITSPRMRRTPNHPAARFTVDVMAKAVAPGVGKPETRPPSPCVEGLELLLELLDLLLEAGGLLTFPVHDVIRRFLDEALVGQLFLGAFELSLETADLT